MKFNDTSIIDAFSRHADFTPEKIAYQFLDRGESVGESCTYSDLYRRSCQIAGWLNENKLSKKPTILLLPNNLRFIETFLGCLIGGIITVPQNLPRISKPLDALLRVVNDCGARAIITTREFGNEIMLRPEIKALELAWLFIEECPHTDDLPPYENKIDSNDIAFLQYTSGSTGHPKGVMVTHSNLFHNEVTIQKAMRLNSESIIVNWLPLFHDMGLIGGVLQPLFSGAHCIVMDPLAFLQKPIRWLQAISRFHATTTGGPNFAYDLCVKRITDDQCEGLDLGSLTVAFSGAEPVRANTIEAFVHKFTRLGFRSQAFFPCYGMAEHTLYISGVDVGNGASILQANTQALINNQRIEFDTDADTSPTAFVSCGTTVNQTQLKIVDTLTRKPLTENRIGEVWVQSNSVAGGYWRKSELTREVFAAEMDVPGESGHYLRTGDLGFIHNGELYVTGRCKDVVIIRGRNYYPSDIEAVVQHKFSDLISGSGAAFGVDGETGESLVLVQELTRAAWRRSNSDKQRLIRDIGQAITQHFAITLFDCVLTKPGIVPRTTSGKVRRSLCKQQYLMGRLHVSSDSEPLEVVRADEKLKSSSQIISAG